MKPFSVRPSLLLGLVVLLGCGVAQAQGPPQEGEGPKPVFGSTSSRLGRAPGSGAGSLGNSPVTGQILGGRPGTSTPRGIPTSISTPSTILPTVNQQPISAPEDQGISPSSAPLLGTIEVPEGAEDDGPADGVTLDTAITVTLQRSLDLRSKFYEIPQAKADTLQAGLRANPIFYADAQLVPYGQYSRSVPGGPMQYDVNVTYPVDVTGKRKARTMVAKRAERVLEAQYQEAVRQRIDDVYDSFVYGVLAARQTVRYARSSVKGLQDLVARTDQLYQKGGVSLGELNRIKNQFRTAQLGLVDAEARYRKAKLDMGSLMNLSRPEIEAMSVRGTIQDDAPPPPPTDELIRIAQAERPDVISYRLGVNRAQADVRLARANRLNDVYVLAQPFTFQNNTPYGMKSAYSWALGVTVPLPVYNRNQGGILRATLNVDQTKTELADLERAIAIEVEKAAQEYAVTRQEVDVLKSEIIPAARQVQQEAYRLYLSGETSIVTYINAQLDFNSVAKQYLDTAIRHRRSMLNLNTVTGKRIMP